MCIFINVYFRSCLPVRGCLLLANTKGTEMLLSLGAGVRRSVDGKVRLGVITRKHESALAQTENVNG